MTEQSEMENGERAEGPSFSVIQQKEIQLIDELNFFSDSVGVTRTA